MRSL
ncbi:uncharacterized protein FFC1_12648 [Fusarium fujikuroi]|jgi:ACS family pantothenate transporter-like MFS transporter